MNRLKIIVILFISLIYQQNGISQANSSRYDVYSDFISQSVSRDDTTFNTKTAVIFITTLNKKYALDELFDIEYLEGYLTGDLSNHPMEEQFRARPSSYFNTPPYSRFGEQLRKDSTYGFMILELQKLSQRNNSLKNSFVTDYETRLIKSPKKYFKMGWKKFHNKYKNCLGIIRLSDVVFSDNGNLAAFIYEDYKGSLFGSGNIVFLERSNDRWIIKYYLSLWIS